MAASRKLQGEIDKVLKKVEEGVEDFDKIWEKVYSAPQQNLKEKFENDLKKEIKKLQRLRDQIKTWLAGSEIKEKQPLIDMRKLIETKMEQFKICEKDTKTKAYSREGLAREEKLDPRELEKEEKRIWTNGILEKLNEIVEVLESDMEKMVNAKNKTKLKEQIERLDSRIQKNKFHILKLEQINRLLDNDSLEPSAIEAIKEDVEFYVDCAGDDETALGIEDDFNVYEELMLDDLALAQSLIVEVDTSSSALLMAGEDVEDNDDEKAADKNKKAPVTVSKAAPVVVGAAIASASAKAVVPTVVVAAKSAAAPVSVGVGSKAPTVVAAAVAAKAGPPVVSAPVTATKVIEKKPPLVTTTSSSAFVVAGANKPPVETAASRLKGNSPQPTDIAITTASSAPISMPSAWVNAAASGVSAANNQATTSKIIVNNNSSNTAKQTTTGEAAIGTNKNSASSNINDSNAVDNSSTASASYNLTPGRPVSNNNSLGDLGQQKTSSLGGPSGANAANVATMQMFSNSNKLPLSPLSSTTSAMPPNPSLDSSNLLGGSRSDSLQQQMPPRQNQGNSEMQLFMNMLKSSMTHAPPPDTNDKNVQSNIPVRPPYPVHPSFPVTVPPILESPAIFDRLPIDCLFLSFYFQQGSYQQYMAAKYLKKHSWRFHKKYMTWFQRHEEPQVTTDTYEEGTYVYFDYEAGWCQRIKSEFKFEYCFLEDDLPSSNI